MFFLILLVFSCQSNGARLSICADLPLSTLKDRDEGYLAHVIDAKEKVILLKVTATPSANPDCETRELPVSADKVTWAGFANPALDKALKIALLGRELNGHFTVSEIVATSDSEAAPATPTGKSSPPAGKTRSVPPLRASWFWSPDSWLSKPQRIFDSQTTLGLKRIYITVPVSEGRVQHTKQLRQFLQIAHQCNLQVWAVLGDPEAVLERERQHFLTLVGAYQIFNTDVEQQRLDGLQLDIEPYIIPGYQLNPAIWLQK